MSDTAQGLMDESPRRRQLYIMLALTVLAAGLRLYRLTHWPLDGDELYTLRDSLRGGWPDGASKQLLFFLNDILVAPWLELDEFGLRLLPLLFGIGALPVLFVLGRRAFGTPTAILSCVILAFNPWHIYWSQFARYYTLAFLLSMTFALAVFVGTRERKMTWTLLGLTSGFLAILAHSSSGLVVAGCGLWLAGYHIHASFQSRSFGTRTGVAAFIGVGLVGAIVIGRLIRQLLLWQQFGEPWGHRGIPLLMSYGNWVGIGVGLFAVAGLSWMWRDGHKALASFMASWWILPSVAATLLSYFVAVSVSYLFVTLPAVIFLAGWAVARIATAIPTVGHRNIATWTIMATLVLAPLPALVSHYLDGGHLDFRSAARLIETRADVADIVLGDRDGALDHYLTSRSAEVLVLDAERLEEQVNAVSGRGGKYLWLAATVQARGGFNETSLRSIGTWLRDRCTLEELFGRPRLDFKSNYVYVYRCSVPATEEGNGD